MAITGTFIQVPGQIPTTFEDQARVDDAELW